MTTRKTSTLIKSIDGQLATIGNQVGRKRHASLARLGGLIYANRRKVLRALERYERECGESISELAPIATAARSDDSTDRSTEAER